MGVEHVGDVAARVVTAHVAVALADELLEDERDATVDAAVRQGRRDRDAQFRRRYALELLLALPRDEALIICGAFLDAAGAGRPCFSHEDDRQDAAQFWADFAAPHELRAYAMACLDRLSTDHPLLGERTRKALLVDLWAGMPAAWRVEFLRRVDPKGEFVGNKGQGAA